MPTPTRRLRFLLTGLGAALLVTACGGAASPPPSAAPVASPAASPVASPSAAASEAASPSPAASLDLSGAAGAIDELTSYQMDVSILGALPGASATGQTVDVELIADAENDAYQFTISGIEGAPPNGLKVIIIPPDAWVDPGTGTYIKQPGGAAQYESSLENFDPTSLVQTLPDDALAALQLVGDEERNGVPTTHYRADASTTPELAESLGEDGIADFWLAKDGGYLVSMAIDGNILVEGVRTEMQMTIDLSRLNDPTIEITAPN